MSFLTNLKLVDDGYSLESSSSRIGSRPLWRDFCVKGAIAATRSAPYRLIPNEEIPGSFNGEQWVGYHPLTAIASILLPFPIAN